MRELWRDAEHLFRIAGVFVAFGVAFLVARAVLIPEGFGVYGHYRAGALVEARARPLAYAGRAACLDCHDTIGSLKGSGKHAGVGCEACHGPLQAHVADAASVTPEKPDAQSLCTTCHARNLAKPKAFPQIDADHAGDVSCLTCHDPHRPLPLKE
ncbi:MAG TPA: multiheme c-type cytochrome [Candidatus Polarisedimenticolaceae bacterium]|nr:multiheme c-type cytochrome [Candidatus Polarisedimenticolaceae bacterium]